MSASGRQRHRGPPTRWPGDRLARAGAWCTSTAPRAWPRPPRATGTDHGLERADPGPPTPQALNVPYDSGMAIVPTPALRAGDERTRPELIQDDRPDTFDTVPEFSRAGIGAFRCWRPCGRWVAAGWGNRSRDCVPGPRVRRRARRRSRASSWQRRGLHPFASRSVPTGTGRCPRMWQRERVDDPRPGGAVGAAGARSPLADQPRTSTHPGGARVIERSGESGPRQAQGAGDRPGAAGPARPMSDELAKRRRRLRPGHRYREVFP